AGAAACSGFRPARSRRRRRAPAPARYGCGTWEVLGAANRPSMPHRRAPASPEGWGRRAAAGPADLLPCCGFFRRRTPMRPIILALALALAAPLAAQEGGVAADVLTLDRIMSDPGWIGAPVEAPYWALDGRRVHFQLERPGTNLRDLYVLDLADRGSRPVRDEELAGLDAANPVYDA